MDYQSKIRVANYVFLSLTTMNFLPWKIGVDKNRMPGFVSSCYWKMIQKVHLSKNLVLRIVFIFSAAETNLEGKPS